MKNILIANAVPTNNGDAALVIGLHNKLINNGYNVKISTLNIDIVRKLYPNINWVKAEYDYSKLERKIMRIFPKIKDKILERKIMRNNMYDDIDLVISAPGGYINSYYGIYDRLYCLNIIKKIYNTKIVMYSQSVGPLSNQDNNILNKYINIFDLFMARDEISYNNVKQYKNTIKTNDAAFLLDTTKNNNKINKIAISVREWSHDGRDRDSYIKLIKNIVYKCVDNGNKVEFISTCQGLDNYVNDSFIAKEIKDSLEEKYKTHVEVNDKYYNLDELRENISNFKFVIGTRLHMCILSILSGVPAFNISYEVKGKECYKILKLNEYSIDYNDEINLSMKKLQKFIDNNELLKLIYSEKAEIMHLEAIKHFEYMLNNIF
ncbi:polysaccharide pyruvyl transferase family protein [Clostridium pasteurianum]|uniref:polysaccharide pyruvyl transferase family protein n=1 Tax=Clostridium pasteurianum TaxID=1501 RepID=UPI00226103AB|nr:polysaccharide pyruvyl transferase family protein [Clostridium pasteurianum]UZW14976.1 polysaccharide pyruvyl transferase family protein [Clostridium pasteurianum]